jgi:hypothetical protein
MFIPMVKPVVVERRSQERKGVTYYMKMVDFDTNEVLGHMADISLGGFKLDSNNPIPENKHFRFIMILPDEVADQSYIKFLSRSRWCEVDPLYPNVYNVGFELTKISDGSLKYFKRMAEIFGSTPID